MGVDKQQVNTARCYHSKQNSARLVFFYCANSLKKLPYELKTLSFVLILQEL